MTRWQLQQRIFGPEVSAPRDFSRSSRPLSDRVPNARIQTCGFIADIVISRNDKGQIYHYVIQREGSAEIDHWGQELSFKRALDCIDDFLKPFREELRSA